MVKSAVVLRQTPFFLTGEKPFACGICDMRFIQRYHLERHSLTHTGTSHSSLHSDLILKHMMLCAKLVISQLNKKTGL